MDYLFTTLNYYCERTSTDLLSEPLNLFSNAAFFVAAFYMQMFCKKKNIANHPHVKILIALTYLVGIGSTIFHSFANILTNLCDVIPIGLLVVTAVYFIMRDIFQFSLVRSLLWLGILAATCIFIVLTIKIPALNHSEMYLGPLGALIVLAVYSRLVGNRNSSELLFSSLFFVISLIMRSIDQRFCQIWPHGTHFLWHTFNGLTLVFVMRFYALSLIFVSENTFLMHKKKWP